MKKLMIIILGLLLFSVVAAVSINQVLTQTQINGIDVSSFDLQVGFVRDGNNKIVVACENKICSVDSTMLSVDKEMLVREILNNETKKLVNESYWSGDYVVVNRVKEIKFRKQPWVNMRDETNAPYTSQQLAKWIKARRGKFVSEERKYLEGIQTSEDID